MVIFQRGKAKVLGRGEERIRFGRFPMITSFFKPKKRGSSGAENNFASKKVKKEEPEKENNSTLEDVIDGAKTTKKAKNSKFPTGKTLVKKVCSDNTI